MSMRLAILLCPYIIARARAVSPLLFLSSVLTPCLIQTYTRDQTAELKQAYTIIILYYSAIKSAPEQTAQDIQGQLELNSAG